MESVGKQSASSFLHSDPDGDVVEKIILGGRLYWILENVVKTGLLDALENEAAPISVSSFCEKYAYSDDVTERILNVLASMELVVKTNIHGVWKYSNSQSASKYLTTASPQNRSCAVVAEKSYVETMLSKLPMVVRKGSLMNVTEFFIDGGMSSNQSNAPHGVLENTMDKMNINELKKSTSDMGPKTMDSNHKCSEMNPRNFIKVMDSMIYSTQNVIPRVFDLSGHRKAVDLGGGSGYTAKLLVDFYPQLAIQVFELSHVVNMVQAEFQAQSNNSQRVSFVAGDFFKDDLPPADLYILAHVLHSWSEAQIHELLEKVFTSLPPGGQILILEKFLHEDKGGPVITMSLDIMMSMMGQGRERTASEYVRLLTDRGFVDTQTRSIEGVNIYDAILTTKPDTAALQSNVSIS